MSIHERIASLNLQHVNKSPASNQRSDYASNTAAQPPPPTGPGNDSYRQPPPLPGRQTPGGAIASPKQAPVLPPRQPSQAGHEYGAQQPIPARSPKPLAMGFSGPLTFAGKLQTAGATRPVHNSNARDEQITSGAKGNIASVNSRPPLLPARSTPTATALPSAKPSVPSKPTIPAKPHASTASKTPGQHAVHTATAAKPKRSALDWGFDNKAVAQATPQTNGESTMSPVLQPFINLATKPRIGATPIPSAQQYNYLGSAVTSGSALPLDLSGSDCLQCRDYTRVDDHASHFPRQNVVSLEQLAHDLTAPFQSLTEKARAIFTWLHFNISYNVQDFFNNNLKPSTPESTLRTGLAVCEGYAALFSNLALHAGLEAVVISGYGQGFGAMAKIDPSLPPPPFQSNHAWNAVRLDDRDGGWHLIDATWGAGAITNEQSYKQRFDASWFTMSAEEFAVRHFPTDQSQWYLVSPARALSWEGYMRSPSRAGSLHVLQTVSELGMTTPLCFTPSTMGVDLSAALAQGPKMRFEMRRICPHWDKVRSKGRPKRPFLLTYGNGPDAQRLPFIPMPRGTGWFAIVDIQDVKQRCKIGDPIVALVVTSWDGRDAAGVNASDVVSSMGRKAVAWTTIQSWTVEAI